MYLPEERCSLWTSTRSTGWWQLAGDSQGFRIATCWLYGITEIYPVTRLHICWWGKVTYYWPSPYFSYPTDSGKLVFLLYFLIYVVKHIILGETNDKTIFLIFLMFPRRLPTGRQGFGIRLYSNIFHDFHTPLCGRWANKVVINLKTNFPTII